MAENNYNTTALLTDTLHKLGCKAEITDDGTVMTDYQGERFAISVADSCLFIVIWDYGWYSQPADDEEAVAKLTRAINNVNINSVAKLIYTEDGKNIIVHTKRHAIFMDAIPQLDEYLASLFNSSFLAHRALMQELASEK